MQTIIKGSCGQLSAVIVLIPYIANISSYTYIITKDHHGTHVQVALFQVYWPSWTHQTDAAHGQSEVWSELIGVKLIGIHAIISISPFRTSAMTWPTGRNTKKKCRGSKCRCWKWTDRKWDSHWPSTTIWQRSWASMAATAGKQLGYVLVDVLSGAFSLIAVVLFSRF